MSETPAVTIVMPFRNAAATLPAAVRSILAQSHPHWRLILSDDGSTDGSLAVAQGFASDRVEVVSDGRRLGISARLNATIADVTTPYVARMDADDIAFPERLARQVALLEADPGIDLCASSVVVFRSDGALAGTIRVAPSHAAIAAQPWRGFLFPHPTWLGRAAWFRAHPYRSRYDGAEDQALLYEALSRTRLAGLDEVLLAYREDSRPFGRIFRRRLAYWRAVAGIGLGRGAIGDVAALSLLQPLKIAGDAAHALGAGWARHRLEPADAALQQRWESVFAETAAAGEAVGG